jgi:hypothetical protein
MSNIIPPYINDKLTTINAYIQYLYKAFISFTQNFFVDPSNNITISGRSIQTTATNGYVNLSGSAITLNSEAITLNGTTNRIFLNNNLIINWGTGIPSIVGTIGSLYIDYTNGELYIYTSSWKKITREA